MLRRQPLFIAVEPQLVSSGLQPDKAAALKLLWQTAQGVQFYSGKVRRRKPPSLAFTLGLGDGPVRGLAQQRLSDGTRRIWGAHRASDGNMNIYFWDGGAVTAMAPSLGAAALNETSLSPASFADFTPLGDWMVINKPESKAYLYQGGAATQPADWPALATQYIKKGPFLLALGTGGRKTGVAFSDGDNWETFTPAANNLAGEIFVDDLDTGIICGRPLGSSIAVFSEDQLAAVSYIGSPYQFGQKLLLDGIGAVGKFAVAGDGKNLFGVGRGGVWWTDGNSYRYIDEGFLHDYLQENVNWSQKSKIIAGRNDFRGTYEFFFPMGVNLENSEGWSFDPRTGGWTPISSATMFDERRLLTKPLAGGSNGNITLIDDDPTAAGALSLQTKPLLLQLQDQTGLRDVHTDTKIDEVELLLKTASNVQFRYGVSGEVDAVPEWGVWQNVNPAQRTYKLEALPTGVYHWLAFQSTATNWDLDLQGFMLFGQVEGSKRGTQ